MFEDSAFEIPRTMSSVTCSVSKRIESRDVTTRIAFGFIQYSRCSNAALLECPIEAHRRRTSTAYAKTPAERAGDAASTYTDRIATIGWTDAARRAGMRLATTATSMATAAPAP